MGMAGPRFFGFVIGGSLPAALAANWLAAAWDQNAAFDSVTPAASQLEAVALEWLLDAARAARRAAPARSSPAPPWPTSPRSPRPGMRCSARPGLGRRGRRPVRRAADHGRRRRGGAPDADQGARAAGLRAQPARARARRRAGPHARRRLPPLSAGRRSSARRPATSTPARSIRCAAIAERTRAAGRLGARRRRVRPVGGRGARARAPRGGHRSWPTPGRPTRTSGSTCPYDSGLAFVRDADALRAAMAVTAEYLPAPSGVREPVGLHARAVAPRARRRGLGGAALARPRGPGRAGRAQLPPRRRASPRGSPPPATRC